MAGCNRLQWRIMLPFVGLVLVGGIVALLLSRHTLGRLMAQRLAVQSQRISQVLSNAQFIFNPVYLEKLRDAIDSEIVVFENDGGIRAATLARDVVARMPFIVDPMQLFAELRGNPLEVCQRTVLLDRRTFLITARLLSDPGDHQRSMMVCVMTDMTDVAALLSAFTLRLLVVGVGGVGIVLILGYWIARSVSRPVDDLVAVTREIAAGRFDRKAALPKVTELRVLSEAINAMSGRLDDYQDQVARSSRLAAAGKITAAMAHEIKNPLSSIKMFVQLLRDQMADTPTNREMVNAILDEISRLQGIVDGLFSTLRPITITPAVTDLHQLIDQLIPVLRPKMAHRKITIQTDFQYDLGPLFLDVDKIRQVLWNLLVNAMDSRPAGGNITIRTRAGKQNSVVVLVEDDGRGFDAKQRERLFDPFFTTKPEGLGLGLSVSREIVSAHGGTLTLENRAPAGVCATMTLPLQPNGMPVNG